MPDYQHIVNVEGIIKKDEHYLTVIRSEVEEHAAGMLSFIGGKVEFTEHQNSILETSLKREIREEVGVEVSNIHYLTNTGFFADDGMSVVNIVFVCDWKSGRASVLEPDEVATVHWMTLAEIRSHPRTPPWIITYIDALEAFVVHNNK